MFMFRLNTNSKHSRLKPKNNADIGIKNNEKMN